MDPIVEKVNDGLVMIISGDVQDRRIKLYMIKEKEFINICKNITAPFYGGMGSTLSRCNDELYLFFGLGQSGYINSVSSLRIDEKVIEGDVKKKRANRNYLLEWNIHRDIDSESDMI